MCGEVDSSFDICGNSGSCCIAIQLAVTWSRPLCDIGAAPQAVVLIGVRWVLYKLKRWHYYLLGEAAMSVLNPTKSCRHPCCVFAHPQLASLACEFVLSSECHVASGACADFCYFANIMLLVQLWLLPKSALLYKVRWRTSRDDMFSWRSFPCW